MRKTNIYNYLKGFRLVNTSKSQLHKVIVQTFHITARWGSHCCLRSYARMRMCAWALVYILVCAPSWDCDRNASRRRPSASLAGAVLNYSRWDAWRHTGRLAPQWNWCSPLEPEDEPVHLVRGSDHFLFPPIDGTQTHLSVLAQWKIKKKEFIFKFYRFIYFIYFLVVLITFPTR